MSTTDTDTDDTDLLLLIPPNYFHSRSDKPLPLPFPMDAQEAQDALAMPAPTTAAYQFLHPCKKTELNQINARLQNVALDGPEHEAPPSDISSISTNTVRTTAAAGRQLHGMVHSTPKGGSADGRHDPMLQEIDHYLGDPRWRSDHLLRPVPAAAPASNSLPSMRLPSSQSSCAVGQARCSLNGPKSNKLISLSELWGRSNSATVLDNYAPSQRVPCSPSHQEEQLRRQHLEKTVHQLQSQLLECQQRISVAIEVDRSKDAALAEADHAAKSLNYEVQQLRDTRHRLEAERGEWHGKADSLQHELAQAVGLATKFQDKNEKLEREVEHLRQDAKEWDDRMEQLELQLHGSQRAEELTHSELNKLRDKFAKVDYQQEKLKGRIEELEKEKSTLTNQKEMLQDYHQKQKNRADALESQRKSLQESLANLTEMESNMRKKLEVQQKSLKQYYQQQMENVVTKKMQEFQQQLDRNEEHLKAEARERERLIAERAVKQLEMINEKNNQELGLIQEKHREEVELYRLQLANASTKIEELELKLSCYKTKRADIAEKLHVVMETQWQQALAILTSPHQQSLMTASDTDGESPDLNNARVHPEAGAAPETPKTSKSQRSNSTEKNNLDVVGKRDPPSPMDKLQAYIELLLSKSPSDFDKLDEILALSGKRGAPANKPKSAGGKQPPPWKC